LDELATDGARGLGALDLLRVADAAADNNIDVWLDGVAQPALSVSSTMRRDYNGSRFTFPTFNTVWFGWWQFQASNTVRDVYLDDLALSTTRVGCGN